MLNRIEIEALKKKEDSVISNKLRTGGGVLSWFQDSGDSEEPLVITEYRLRRVFQMFDTDKSDQIDKAEFQNAGEVFLPSKSARYYTELFDIMDADGNGFIDFSEFRKCILDNTPFRKFHQTYTLSELRQLFHEYDTSRDGLLQFSEFENISTVLGFEEMSENSEDLTVKQNLMLLFDFFDKDKSGQIDCNEFCESMLGRKLSQSDEDVIALENQVEDQVRQVFTFFKQYTHNEELNDNCLTRDNFVTLSVALDWTKSMAERKQTTVSSAERRDLIEAFKKVTGPQKSKVPFEKVLPVLVQNELERVHETTKPSRLLSMTSHDMKQLFYIATVSPTPEQQAVDVSVREEDKEDQLEIERSPQESAALEESVRAAQQADSAELVAEESEEEISELNETESSVQFALEDGDDLPSLQRRDTDLTASQSEVEEVQNAAVSSFLPLPTEEAVQHDVEDEKVIKVEKPDAAAKKKKHKRKKQDKPAEKSSHRHRREKSEKEHSQQHKKKHKEKHKERSRRDNAERNDEQAAVVSVQRSIEEDEDFQRARRKSLGRVCRMFDGF